MADSQDTTTKTLTVTDSQAASSWGRSARETIESIAIAFALAFLFKSFEAEAFVIPTGSMAPTLMGRHKDVVCPECGYRYTASGSDEADRNGNVWRTRDGQIDQSKQVIGCTCPNCRFYMSVDPLDTDIEENPSYSGDRIWVSKIPYHISEPSRWDVIVFRFPEEAETYYIKRLIGLPNETVRIWHGDIYTKGVEESDFVLQRKPPEKVRAMSQIVHDNDYVSKTLTRQGWPLGWHSTSDDKAGGAWQASEDTRTYHTDGKGEAWIRYEHRMPTMAAWEAMLAGRWSSGQDVKPQLITDFYAFNTRVLREGLVATPSMWGLHWVGDLILEAELDIQSASGVVMADLVKAGRHFRASFDVADGQVTLSIDGVPDWQRTAKTSVRGPGKHHVMFANVDRQLLLWVDDKLVEFDEPATYDQLDDDRPSSGADGGDLAPVGIGSRGAALTATHLRVLRDIYYIADNRLIAPISDYRGPSGIVPLLRSEDLAEFFATPQHWNIQAGNVFDARRSVDFKLDADQFFVLGDNSPASSDARFWMRGHYVERELLIGKALYVYWPHPLNIPIPLTDSSIPVVPNVRGMGFIR
jgi:signal peptidase I